MGSRGTSVKTGQGEASRWGKENGEETRCWVSKRREEERKENAN